MRLRDYSTELGRFTSTDPVSAKSGTPFAQTYHFAYNSPTSLGDPSGGCPWCIGALVGAVAGAVVGGVVAAATGENVWAGIGYGAVGGAIIGGTLGIASNAATVAGMGFWGTTLVMAGAGAVGSVGAGAFTATLQNRSYSGQQALWDGSVGALAGGSGPAVSAGLKAGAPHVDQALIKALQWVRANRSPGPIPAGQSGSYACAGSEAAGGTSVTSSIGANQVAGDAARDAIAAARPGSQIEHSFSTSRGIRRVDVLTAEGIAIEPKVGLTSLTASIEQQIAKDVLLRESGRVSSVEWIFSASGVTGRAGPTGPLGRALDEAGISWSLAGP